MMESAKRARCTNFSSAEMEALLALVEKHQKVIECKKTDAVSNRDKDTEWEKLTDNFNGVVGTGRTAKQIRMKWDAWKKSTRKRYSSWRSSLYATGGGKGESPLSEWEQRILVVMGISATGIDCPYDSNNTEFKVSTIVPYEVVENVMDLEVSIISDDPPQPSTSSQSVEPHEEGGEKQMWKQWNPTALKRPLHRALLSGDEEKTKIPKRRKRIESSNNKYELLLDTKLEFLRLQMDILKREHEAREARNAEKHALEILALQNKCTRCKQEL